MELWRRVIIEWVNCLDILEKAIKELKELEDERFYQHLINLLSWKHRNDTLDEEDIVRKFIQDEYPEFKLDNEGSSGGTEHVYIASLFLLYTSQEPIFHQPMCTKLQHETQVKIKTFLEMIIPHGKDITKEKLSEVIAELEDTAPETPMTPRTRALKDFFNSPAARSAQSHKIMTERNRELRKLKTELEVERFEKADLQEDLKLQQNKINNLQKKLQDKVMEIKALKEERMRPNTPQSCKKNKNTLDNEQYYKKEVDCLEDQLMQRQYEMEKLEGDNDTLSKKLACTERQYILLTEKLEKCEKSLENLQIQGEVKDRELVNLRMTNEELRMHLKELNKTSIEEQSFEVDGVLPLHSLSLLNNSEALSSVIDIQLQEAKEESASLKSQLDILNKKLESVIREHSKMARLNAQLQEKASMLQDTEARLNTALDKLSLSSKDNAILQEEKASLICQNKCLEDLCASQKESLLEAEESRSTLSLEVNNLKEKIKESEECLQTEHLNIAKLNAALADAESEINGHLRRIQNLTQENDSYKTSTERYNTDLKQTIRRNSQAENTGNINVDDKTTAELIEYLKMMLHSMQEKYVSKEAEVKSLNHSLEEAISKLQDLQIHISELEVKHKQSILQISELNETIKQNVTNINDLQSHISELEIKDKQSILQISELNETIKQNVANINDLQSDISELEIKDKQSILQIFELEENVKRNDIKINDLESHISELELRDKQSTLQISELNEVIKQNVTQINELTSTVHQYSEEISHLKKIEIQKEALDVDIRRLKDELNERNCLLKSLTMSTNSLKQDLSILKKKLHSTKEEVLKDLNEYQKENEETGSKISNDYKALCDNFNKEQIHRKELEDKLADKEKELKSNRNKNTTLETNLLKKEETLKDLEARLTDLRKKFEQSVQDIEQLESTKQALQEQYEATIIDKNLTLKNLKLENEKLLSDLKCMTDKLSVSQQEANVTLEQAKLKDERIENLVSEIASLKQEKDRLIRLQKEGESKREQFIEQLETKLLEKQLSWDQLNIEAKLKEETLQLLQNKFEKLTKETISSELKMKEVIMNLQEVRANQDAVATTQEKALKEKCSHLELLQKEFNESKNALCKQLNDEKSLRENLQSTCSELQIQSYEQMKTIEGLQEVLKRERNELKAKKEYCTTEDTRKSEIAKVCKELEHSINDLKSTMGEAVPGKEDFDSNIKHDLPCAESDEKTARILKIIQTAVNEVHASRKLILHLFNTNASVNEILEKQQVIVDNYVTKCKEIKLLKDQVQELESMEQKHVKHLNNLMKRKESLRDCLQNIMKSREDLDASLSALKKEWSTVLTAFHSIFAPDKSVCDELKHIQAMKTDLEDTLSKYNVYHLENMKTLNNILWQEFLWTEEKLEDSNSHPMNKTFDVSLDTTDKNCLNEKTAIDAELEKNTTLQKDIARFQIKIEDFSKLVASFEIDFKSDQTRFQSEVEKKLQARVKELTEEKNDVESRLDCLRMRSAMLEGHVEEMRNKIKELEEETVPLTELEDSRRESARLKEENSKLREERDELSKRPKKEDLDVQLKEFQTKYEVKLDEMKQRMKTAYNEQVLKLNRDQEKCLQDRLESLQKKMEQQCRKQAEEISKYKAHVTRMSEQFWNVGENLLTEQQQNQKLRREIEELKAKLEAMSRRQTISAVEHRSSKVEKKDFFPGDNKEEVTHKIAVIQERTTYERRCSIRSIQTMGNAFNAEDEEGEVFDNTYLADMKQGQASFSLDTDRLSTLQKRNALCKPHLKSSYPAEMQFHHLCTEEEIKTGSVPEEIFNDSLSQSLLPEQKTKKKDRTQTSYKKPGPPTPSKNGGRLSLQGNELKSPSSRILRERNKDRTTATPRTLKSLFSSKRQDELHQEVVEEAVYSVNIEEKETTDKEKNCTCNTQHAADNRNNSIPF